MNFSALYQGFLFVVFILVSTSTAANAEPVPDIIVTDYTLQSKERVSRTEFKFVYSITVENTGSSALSDIEGSVSVNSGVFSLIDQNLYIPSINPFEVVSNAGQFTILVDRRYAFDPSALVFSFQTQNDGSIFSKNQILIGAPGDQAISVIQDVFNFDGASEVIEDFDPIEGYVIRTRLVLELGPSATVVDVNDLLSNINAKIIASAKGLHDLVIAFPDPGSLEKLFKLKLEIENNPWIEGVFFDEPLPLPNVLPGDYQYSIVPPQDLQKIDHHLAVKSHGIWNVRDKLNEGDGDLNYVIADYFGNGVPEIGDIGASIIIEKNSVIYNDNPNEYGHGYHVLGITLGSFGSNGSNSEKSLVTGIYPNELPVTIIDLSHPKWSKRPFEVYTLSVIRHLAEEGRNVVLNTSLGACIAPNKKCPFNTLSKVQQSIQRHLWIPRLKMLKSKYPSISDNLIHVTSAGNAGENTNLAFHYATNNSVFAFSATEFPNVLVVENRVNSESMGNNGFKPKCLNPSSSEAVDAFKLAPLKNGISAIGTNVYSFHCGIGTSTNNPIKCSSSVISNNGTSMASPQVAGAALAVWAAKSEKSATEVVSTLISNAKIISDDNACADRTPAPVLDVYSSVLSLDTVQDNKLRLALLDVSNETWDGSESEINPDGAFGLDDLRRFVSEYISRVQDGTNNTNYDFSRFDLNANGTTGENQVPIPEAFYAFDLDADGFIENSVSKTIEGVPLKFIESYVTDALILCYYAYSDIMENLSDDEKIERTIIMLPILNRCGVDLKSIDITLGGSSFWWGAPTTITLSHNPGSLFFGSAQIWPFSWNGEGSCGSEQGGGFSGVWSSQVESGAWFMPVTKVENHPATFGNRVPCSSFFAVKDGKIWFNATARRWSISGVFQSDREYQIRYFSDPEYASGLSPNVARTNTGVLSLGTVNSVPFGSYFEQQSVNHPDVEFQFNFEAL